MSENIRVYLYPGSLETVKKSGVGQALYHQKSMLEAVGVNVNMDEYRGEGIIHFNTTFPDSYKAAKKFREEGKKIVYYGHSTQEDFKNSFIGSNLLSPLFKKWIIKCYNLGDVIITPSEYSKGLLSGYGINKPIYPLSNGVDTEKFSYSEESRERFRKRYGIGDNEKVVISVGHFMARKGINDFVGLALRMPECRFMWFGYTQSYLVPANIKAVMKSAPSNLQFPGYISQEELRDAYCGADCFAFMSHEETEGIVVLEAMSCGIPTVVRDIPVYEGWLKDSENCFKGSNNRQIMRRVKNIINGNAPILKAGMAKTVQERSYRVLGEKLINIYKENNFI
ncbi:MAG: glycosyltransferase family 4 protein [Firmicutes bacterium]|nr:glycosyltransferase family 4 protein [Bacillota bacterium]